MIYIFAFLISLILVWASNHSKKEAKLISYWIGALPLTLLSAFRYNVGTDYFNTYESGFIAIKNGFNIDGYDWGFTELNKFILLFTQSPQWLFIITSIIISFFIFKTIQNNSENKVLSLYIYFCGGMYFMGMNQLKQFLGMSICLYAIGLFNKKKYTPFFIAIIIAGLFHSVNFIFFLPFLLPQIPIIRRLTHPVYVSSILIGTYLIAHIIITFFFNDILVFTRFYDRYNNSYFAEPNFSLAYFIMNLYVLSLFFFSYRQNKQNKTFLLLYIFKILSTFLVLLSGEMMIIARLSDTYLIADILAIPYALSKITNKYLKFILLIGILLLYGYYWYWSILSLNNHTCFPYNYRLP